MCLVKLSTVVIFLFPTISPPFGEYRCISLKSCPQPACCFHQLRRLRRDQAFSSPILRKMKHWTHISKHVQAEFSHAFWQCVANFTVHFILVAAATVPYSFQLWVFAYSFLTGVHMLTDWWCAFNLLVFCPFACVFLHCCLDNATQYIVSASTSQWSALVTAEGTSNRMNQLCKNGGKLCCSHNFVSFLLILERHNDVYKVA